MGYFSWKTCDTKESIWNSSSGEEVKPVYMILPDDTYFKEDSYEGYGEFGGRDIYEVIAELNGYESDRSHGINITFQNNPSGDFDVCVQNGFIMPKLCHTLMKYDEIEGYPETCPNQGFFHDYEEEDDYEEEEDYDDDYEW